MGECSTPIRLQREKVYQKIEYFWPDLYGSEYALLDIKILSKKTIETIQKATNRVGRIFFKTAKLLRKADDDTLRQLDIPAEMLPYIRHKALPVESIIARCDFVQTDDGIKLLELNADTPTFIKEVFHVNQYIADYFQVSNPNQGLDRCLARSISKAIVESSIKLGLSEPYIVFTSHDDHMEDKYTTLYLRDIIHLPAKYVPLHELKIVQGEGLFDPEGRKIDILYRQTYPLEHLILDEDPETKEKVGLQLLQLVLKRKLAIINPISAFLIQSKAVQAVIWGLYERQHSFFNEEERNWIRSYFLPTYLDEDFFIKNGVPFVKKPAFGREGDSVEIFIGRKKVMEDPHKTYADSLPIFQQYVELPSCKIQTVTGEKIAKYIIGSFLINGKACGIGIRAGGQITDNAAYYLPVGVRQQQ